MSERVNYRVNCDKHVDYTRYRSVLGRPTDCGDLDLYLVIVCGGGPTLHIYK